MPLPVLSVNIPAELKKLLQWVCWRFVWRNTVWSKPLYNPATGQLGDATDPSTWVPFDIAFDAVLSGAYDGLGFALTTGDPYTAFDLDDCFDPRTRQFTNAQAERIVRTVNSYTELSPSGTGVRMLVRGAKTSKKSKKGGVEIYDHNRYVTLTGMLLKEIFHHAH